MSLVEMTWRDTLFAHWPVDEDVVDAHLPPALDADTYDGQAWLSVVGFRMDDIRPRGFPTVVGVSFEELNLRTYVTYDGTPGIYFFNLDASDRLGVALARRFFQLPYYSASMQVTDREMSDGADRVRFRSRRTHRDAPPLSFDAEYGPADEELADPDRAAFLTERYRFYTAGVDAVTDATAASEATAVRVGVVDHDPWSLSPADLTLRRNDLFVANGFETPAGDPVCHYSPGVEVRAERVRRV